MIFILFQKKVVVNGIHGLNVFFTFLPFNKCVKDADHSISMIFVCLLLKKKESFNENIEHAQIKQSRKHFKLKYG